MKIIQVVFPKEQYFQQVFAKTQIVLHHTASGPGISGDYTHWLNDPARIATCVIIDRPGIIHQFFESKYFAHHLGLSLPNNLRLNQHSIGIEMDAWGPLIEVDGKFYSYTGTLVPEEEVITYVRPFRTLPDSPFFKSHKMSGKPAYHYHRYTPEQIQAAMDLCKLWKVKHGIPLVYNPEMWDLSKKAMTGAAGIWTHASYRKDKVDCHPQPDLIDALKALQSP